LKQLTNAYVMLPISEWRGYRAPAEMPPPEPGTWGDHPPLPDALTMSLAEMRAGASIPVQIAALESDPHDGLASALARLGRKVAGLKP
jgi:hypothetical protein